MSKVAALKTSRFDFSMPAARDSTKSRRQQTNSGGKEYYYYYVYRKRVDPSEIKGPEDYPIPMIFRRNNGTAVGGSLEDIPRGRNATLSPLKTSSGSKKSLKRSNSLPEVTKKSSPLKRNPKLKPLKNPPSASKTLPKINRSRSRNISPPSATMPDEEVFPRSGKSIPSLLSMTPRDGLKWSRHTTMIRTSLGVTEKTINIETKKVKKDGKWIEEVVKTKTVTDPDGSVSTSRRIISRDMKPEEINDFVDSKPVSPLKSAMKRPKSPIVEPKKNSITKSGKVQKQTTSTKNEAKIKDELNVFSKEVLAATNVYRSNHGVPPLQISPKLNKVALDWAEKLANSEKMVHGDKKDLGENIYCKTSSQPWFKMSGSEVVENWYQEVEDHNYDEEPSQGFLKTGHFTQLIWEDCKDMGVAFARNKNGHMAFVVAYFYPKGNWIGEFREKVPPLLGTDSKKLKPKSVKVRSTTPRQDLSRDKSKNISEEKGNRSSRLKPIDKEKVSKPSAKRVSKLKVTSRSLDKLEDPKNSRVRSNKNKTPTTRRAITPDEIYSPYSDQASESPSQTIYSEYNPDSSRPSSQGSSKISPRNDYSSSANSEQSYQSAADNSSVGDRRDSVKSLSINSARSSVSSPSHIYESVDLENRSRVSSSASAVSIMGEHFNHEFLKAHNQYRKMHGVDPLNLNEKLSDYAQSWAKQLSKWDRMEHREDNPYGENIYMKWSTDHNHQVPGSEPVESWYSEIQDYHFGQEPLDLRAGHFTQVIWSETAEVGVGSSRSPTGKIYIVANYDPPGNFVGQFSQMVPPVVKSKKNHRKK